MPQLPVSMNTVTATQTPAAASSSTNARAEADSAGNADFAALLGQGLQSAAATQSPLDSAAIKAAENKSVDDEKFPAVKEHADLTTVDLQALIPLHTGAIRVETSSHASNTTSGGAANDAIIAATRRSSPGENLVSPKVTAEEKARDTEQGNLSAGDVSSSSTKIETRPFSSPIPTEKSENTFSANAGDHSRAFSDMNAAATPLASVPNAPIQSAEPPKHAASLEPAVGTRDWNNALGQQVVWMAGKDLQVAELHLNPPDLGPLHVTLSISNDQASALFVSHHAAVRDAIEAALPRLREIFADNSITLGQATVSADTTPRQQAQFGGEFADGRRTPEESTETASSGTSFSSGPRTVRVRQGLVDTFA